MAGGINNFGTTIGPLIVSFAIFGSTASGSTDISIESVKIPYLILGAAFLILALLLKFSSLPEHPETIEESKDEKKIFKKISFKLSSIGIGNDCYFSLCRCRSFYCQ